MARNFFAEQLSKADASDIDSTVHVLAVDDSFVDRKVIEKMLKTLAFKVTTVDSGKRALEMLGLAGEDYSSDSLNVNLIITDYCMPGMTGYDLLKAIKESSALKEIPVVIMSSENVPNRINRCLEEGAEEFILKPVKLADVKRLRGHVRQQCADNSTIKGEVEETCSKRKISKDGSKVHGSEERRSFFSRSHKF